MQKISKIVQFSRNYSVLKNQTAVLSGFIPFRSANVDVKAKLAPLRIQESVIERYTFCPSSTKNMSTWQNQNIDNFLCPIQNTIKGQLLAIVGQNNNQFVRFYSDKKEVLEEKPKEVLSRAQKLKTAVKEYGSTVIVFHITISLLSLGTCYTLVSSGIDMAQLISYIPGLSESSSNVLVSNTGTFVTAYAIHKVFAPVRISMTLGATPFIVRYLRAKGFIKKP